MTTKIDVWLNGRKLYTTTLSRARMMAGFLRDKWSVREMYEIGTLAIFSPGNWGQSE